ncbi:MAG: asparagine synthase-related protein [Coxiellaceae bacterium]|nr:asparagine synthase-related protein [Coxiellaceae bacterium]
MRRYLANFFRPKAACQSTQLHPYEYMYYASVREAECNLLQGHNSHEIRMRIEYSSIVSKKMGFEYRYPLLYPKLLEFMLRVPTIQKRRDGRGRYLIRQYLSRCLGRDMFSSYRKQDGLAIVPGTFSLFTQNFEKGHYDNVFKNCPYSHFIQNKHLSIASRNSIKAFMLKGYLN